MNLNGAIFVVFWSAALVHGQSLNNHTRKRVNEEARSGEWHSIELPLDHFDILDNRTFRARYITNDQFYKKGGPIIVYIGGEWEIEEYGVMGGVAFQLARQHNGYLFYPEHRYFGKSLPFPQPVSVENLRYITPDYSLADLVYSLSHLKDNVDGLKDSQVVAVGGSYAGSLAIWGRLKYPHIINIVYACGGVINTDTFNEAYYEVNYRAWKKINPECIDIVKSGLDKAYELLQSEEGSTLLDELFPSLVCNTTDVHRNMARRIHACFNSQIWAIDKSPRICHYLVANTTGSPLERLSQVVSDSPDSITTDKCSKLDPEWYYLVCTFIGNIIVSGESNYGDHENAGIKFKEYCVEHFGFTQEFVNQRTRRSTIFYGSDTPDVTKVLSLQGTHDPWYPHAILDDLNDETPVVYIEDATHCLELGEEQDDESPQVAQAKTEVLQLLAKWIR